MRIAEESFVAVSEEWGGAEGSPISLMDRVRARLLAGATLSSIAAGEGISLALAEIMVDDLERRGLAASADSLCSSGLGACGSGASPETMVTCAGCPLVPLRLAKRPG